MREKVDFGETRDICDCRDGCAYEAFMGDYHDRALKMND